MVNGNVRSGSKADTRSNGVSLGVSAKNERRLPATFSYEIGALIRFPPPPPLDQ